MSHHFVSEVEMKGLLHGWMEKGAQGSCEVVLCLVEILLNP